MPPHATKFADEEIVIHELTEEGTVERIHTVQDLWIAEPNSYLGITFRDFLELPKSSTQQIFLKRLCQQHLVYISCKALLDNFRNKGSALDCKVCERYSVIKDRADSELEQIAFSIVRDLELGDVCWVQDAKCVKGSHSSADVWFPVESLILMIDGPLHWKRHHDLSAEKQMFIDRTFDDMAVLAGQSVLRLHHADIDCWSSMIKAALVQCRKYTASNQVRHKWYTRSYGLLNDEVLKTRTLADIMN